MKKIESATKEFDLRVILTVTTGRLLTKAISKDDNGIGGVYEILDFLWGTPTFTHTIPKRLPIAKETILIQYPELEDINQVLFILEKRLELNIDIDIGIESWINMVRDMGFKDTYSIKR